MSANDDLIQEFKGLAKEIPAIRHPWFQGIIDHEFTKEQLIAGEIQHYLRNRLNAKIFATIVIKATEEGDDDVLAKAIENLRDEVCGPKTHGDLMYQFLEEHGISKREAAASRPMPGTMAGVAMITQSIQEMSALEGIALMSLSEWQNGGPDGTAAAVYSSYREHYGFSDYAAETYREHSTADEGHGDMQLELLAAKVRERPEIKESIMRAMKFGIVAFNYEWDGHCQAATGNEHFHWEGVSA